MSEATQVAVKTKTLGDFLSETDRVLHFDLTSALSQLEQNVAPNDLTNRMTCTLWALLEGLRLTPIPGA